MKPEIPYIFNYVVFYFVYRRITESVLMFHLRKENLMKKIISVSQTYNHSDIIESFCRYTLTFCDLLIILDKGSNDGSVQVVEKLIREGLSIKLLPSEPTLTDNQRWDVLISFAKTDIRISSIIMELPPDAFLYSKSKRSIKTILNKLPLRKHVSIKGHVMLPLNQPILGSSFLPLYFQQACPQEYDVTTICFQVAQCRNLIFSSRLALLTSYENDFVSETSDELALALFPIRSPRQIMVQGITQWANILALSKRTEPQTLLIKTQKWLYEKLKFNGLPNDSDLPELAFEYAVERYCESQKLTLDCDITRSFQSAPSWENIPLLYTDYSKSYNDMYDLILAALENALSPAN